MKKEIKISVAISILVITVTLLATMINLLSATNALRTSLTNNYLQNNYNYSNKLAENIENLTSDMQKSIIAMAKLASDPNFKQSHLDILHESENGHFNSILTTDEHGVVQLISPNVIQSQGGKAVGVGTKIQSNTIEKALSIKKPFISEPYKAMSGRLIMLVSAPIWSEQGAFKGVMAGTIYLESQSVLNTLLKSHRYEDDSYVFVVDKNGVLIFHPDTKRINERVTENTVVNKIIQGESGFAKVKNTKGTDFFAGYSYIENLGWGVVSQTPTSILHEPLYDLIIEIVIESITILIILLIVATLLVKNITKPLTQLAEYSEDAIQNKEINKPIHEIHTNSQIYEINRLYCQLKSHFIMLNKEIQLDGLTQIANRRTFDFTIKKWIEEQPMFSLIMIDIDKFKLVNDTYGHLVGDDVLKYVASIISSFSREDDLSFRYGGEEFGILIKDKNEMDAFHTAEQIRLKVAQTNSPTGQPLTISLGVTSFKESDIHPKSIIERADKALFQSKKDGRNRTTIYNE